MSSSTALIRLKSGQDRHRAARKSASNITSPVSGRAPMWGLAPLVLGVVLWQIFGSEDSIYFPRPSTWVTALVEYAQSGDLWKAIGATLLTFVASFVLAIVIGVALGILVGGVPWLDRMLGPILEFIRAIPSSAKVPVFVLLLGYTTNMKIVVVVIAAVFPILLNTRSGMQELNPLLSDVGRTLHLSRAATIRKILLPSLLAPILTGIRIATPVVLIVVLVVEILTKVPGLGGSLSLSQSFYQSSLMYGLIVVTTLVALAVNTLVGWADDRMSRRLRR